MGAGLSSLFPGIDPVALGVAAGALSDKIEPFATKTGEKLNEVVDNVSGRIGEARKELRDLMETKIQEAREQRAAEERARAERMQQMLRDQRER